jgi:hypothetical protein
MGRGDWDDPFARATRGLRREGWVAWPSSCSRNAHDRNVLVRRAHSRIDQATPLNRKTSELGRISWKDIGNSLNGELESEGPRLG